MTGCGIGSIPGSARSTKWPRQKRIEHSLAVEPDFIICDEPVSALDVSNQAQILSLLTNLQSELGLTYLFVAHDLSVVRHINDRVAVMYLGRIVEVATSADLYRRPLHPYTYALISGIPVPDPRIEARRQRVVLGCEPANPADPPTGCHFHPRCHFATEQCAIEKPELREIDTRDIKIAAMDGGYNMIHPDKKVRADGLRKHSTTWSRPCVKPYRSPRSTESPLPLKEVSL